MNYTIVFWALCMASAAPLIGMQKDLEITYKDQEIPIDRAKVVDQAKRDFPSLGESRLFDTQLIKQPAFQQSALAKEKSRVITIRGENNHPINAILIDRGSDKVMVLGAGFKAQKEKLVPFLAIYPHYDLLFFDHSAPYTEGLLWTM